MSENYDYFGLWGTEVPRPPWAMAPNENSWLRLCGHGLFSKTLTHHFINTCMF